MTKISQYQEIVLPDVDDLLIGTDVENSNATKNFSIQSIVDLVSAEAGITPTLQQVTTAGNETVTDITANKFKIPGGTSSEILAANGDVITAGDNITIVGGIISSTGGGGGTGPQGPVGPQGIQGPSGADGAASMTVSIPAPSAALHQSVASSNGRSGTIAAHTPASANE